MITVNDHIIGGPQVDSTVLHKRLVKLSPNVRDQITCAYTAFGQLSRIGNLIPFAQAIHESTTFTSWWWINHCNPTGIGVTGRVSEARPATGEWQWDATATVKLWKEGSHFANPAEGIAAHFAHLLAYASKLEELSYAQRLLLAYDPRLEALTKAWGRGCAPTWNLLDGKWAVPGNGYSTKIIQIANSILKGA